MLARVAVKVGWAKEEGGEAKEDAEYTLLYALHTFTVKHSCS